MRDEELEASGALLHAQSELPFNRHRVKDGGDQV